MNELYIDKFCHFGKKINVAAVYPNSYKFGISNLGHQIFYRLLNQTRDINCERFYLEIAVQTNLTSLETSKKLQNFDVLAFSVCYELDIYNIAGLLKKYSWLDSVITKKKANRPLIICGGALTFINPEILDKYSDFTICGDFENIAESFEEFLNNAVQSDNFENLKNDYTFIYKKKKIILNSNAQVEAYSSVIPLNEDDSEFSKTFLVEITRGCPNNCVFCSTGATRNPVRYFSNHKLNELINVVEQLKIPKIGFIGSAVLLYPELKKILQNLIDRNINFSFSSLTINQLDNEIINLLVKTGQNTITLAPETGNDRMLKLINKKINFDRFFELVCAAVKAGIKRIKLYFMYGFEEDDTDDVMAVIDLINKIKLIVRQHNKPFNLVLSFNPVIPKPYTPYAEKAMLSKKTLERKKKILRSSLIHSGARLEFMSINEAVIQYKIANNIFMDL